MMMLGFAAAAAQGENKRAAARAKNVVMVGRGFMVLPWFETGFMNPLRQPDNKLAKLLGPWIEGQVRGVSGFREREV
jgi:hypothetical protein